MKPMAFRTRNRWLRRAPDGWIFGVCLGLSRAADLPVLWVRVILVVVALCTWVVPALLLYLLAAFLMKPQAGSAPGDWRDYRTNASDCSVGLTRLTENLDGLERRIQDQASWQSLREKGWDHRLQSP